jgi:hypothetical protein
MSWSVSPLAGKTTDWRAVCGKFASPVRREGASKPIGASYPYPKIEAPRSPERDRPRIKSGGDKPGDDEYAVTTFAPLTGRAGKGLTLHGKLTQVA